ncbi:TonB-dependent receptor domain-containing protein [Peristeroidobacter agariperforans]|uniref:TonB-dependent receptor domain-containing protein n=1 Tax=Peristeroidobacter agariperforans TaxID=268404 RepID=UPI00101D36C3|nr:TonB-dependent receptor [Peristeroidobacter agariperforans]
MSTSKSIRRAVHLALWTGAATVTAAQSVYAAEDQNIQEVVVTGTRISVPGAISSSPILSIGTDEISMQQATEIEQVFRDLPVTAVGDGSNVNNGTAGAATLNLRGLGAQRNLILIDGKRVTPFNYDGQVDTSIIPTALIERVDIVTGGASAVYGSDAIAGAVNFVMKRDFEGVDLSTDFSQFDEKDGDVRSASFVMGANVADGRGNIVVGLNWTDREPVMLGDRPLGQLGIVTASGAGYQNFLNGVAPTPAPDGCGGPNSVASGGSTTTLPTRVAIAGGGSIGQFRDNGNIGPNCSVFNFNPYNYYQTPLQRVGGMVMGHFEMNEHAEAYARFGYTSTEVRQQIAASGIFGSAFWTPLSNPFINASAQQTLIDAYNTGRGGAEPIVSTGGDFPNWRDLNGNGVVDAADDVRITYSRRTVEFGPRSTTYENNSYNILVGVRGQLIGDWDYDVFGQYGEAERSNVSAGYTSVTNAADAVDAIMGPNGVPVCRSGNPGCVPLNLFGGFGSITPEMAAYSSASAIEQQAYEQKIVGASVSGPINAVQIPWAGSPLAMSFGVEYREEFGTATPDLCWQTQPASCLGGAGGSILPIAGGFDVREVFGEVLLPLASDLPGVRALDLEAGYRYADYDPSGANRTYKYGLSYKPVDQVLFRVMKQRAARAPNVGELAAPNTTALDNATIDPCSVANAGSITPELRALCMSTGMTAGQVGVVNDLVSGQVNSFQGTDLNNLPTPEQADTLTVGVVWTPDFIPLANDVLISLDYYDIDISDVIGEFGAQEVLDACYVGGIAEECAKIRRIGGGLTLDGSGIETYTTNLKYLRAEGVELGVALGFDIGKFGNLRVSANVNKYLTHESQSSSLTPLVDCVGTYGTNCGNGPQGGPLPETRWLQRTSWMYNDFTVSLLWRHLSGIESAVPVFPKFQKIDSYDYFDLFGSWQFMEQASLSFGINNLFEKDPPVVGNEAADTGSNSGNTFPQLYDALGRQYAVGLRFTF